MQFFESEADAKSAVCECTVLRRVFSRRGTTCLDAVVRLCCAWSVCIIRQQTKCVHVVIDWGGRRHKIRKVLDTKYARTTTFFDEAYEYFTSPSESEYRMQIQIMLRYIVNHVLLWLHIINEPSFVGVEWTLIESTNDTECTPFERRTRQPTLMLMFSF